MLELFGGDQKYFCVLFASRGPKPSFKFLVVLICLLALRTREGILFFLRKSNKAENFSVFKEEPELESRCDIMKHKLLADPKFLWICYFTQICNLPTLLTLQLQRNISPVWYLPLL